MNFKLKRKLIIALILVFIALAITGCGNSKPKNNSPEGAAQIVVKAIAEQDSELFSFINKTNIPTDLMLEEAHEIGWTGRSYIEFEYEVVQNYEDARFFDVIITDPENEGELTLTFMEFPDGKFYFTE